MGTNGEWTDNASSIGERVKWLRLMASEMHTEADHMETTADEWESFISDAASASRSAPPALAS